MHSIVLLIVLLWQHKDTEAAPLMMRSRRRRGAGRTWMRRYLKAGVTSGVGGGVRSDKSGKILMITSSKLQRDIFKRHSPTVEAFLKPPHHHKDHCTIMFFLHQYGKQ